MSNYKEINDIYKKLHKYAVICNKRQFSQNFTKEMGVTILHQYGQQIRHLADIK